MSLTAGGDPSVEGDIEGVQRAFPAVGPALSAFPGRVEADHGQVEDLEGGLRRDLDDLEAVGLDVTLIDLREPALVSSLATYDIVWVRGGNVFVLRRVLADTGADTVLLDLLRRDAVVYGGYSAGACVLAPDLNGLELVDNPAIVAEPIMTGLGLLDRPFVPHVRSPGHPETASCDAVSAAYTSARRPHWALRDGEVLLVTENQTRLLPV